MEQSPTTYVDRLDSGAYRIRGTRVSLDSIVQAYWQGKLPETMASDFPTLSLEMIHGALAYYLRHQKEVEQYLSEQDTRWLELQERSNREHEELLERLRHKKSAYGTSGRTF